MKLQNILIILFSMAVIGAGTVQFLNHYELKEQETFIGYLGEARTNNLFAARLFLKRMGIPTERRDHLNQLPDTDTIIVLNTQRYNMGVSKTDELLHWVEQGGHLITRARIYGDLDSEYDEELMFRHSDHLQAALNIGIGKHQMVDSDDLPLQVKLNNMPQARGLELIFFKALLESDATNTTNTQTQQWQGHTWLIQRPYGAGSITLLASLDFIENYAIDQADHAELLWYLLQSVNPDFKQVWLLHRDGMPNLFSLLYQHAWTVLLSSLLLLLFTFWAIMPRFGAKTTEPVPHRRRLLEHIRASSQFLWKYQAGGREQLIHSTRHALLQNGRLHIYGWALMNEQQQYTALMQRLHYPNTHASRFEHLLQAKTLEEADFIELVQLAHRLRKTT
ncbi:MAG: hypothetical protein CR991_00205 [Proteobacteria bacterium]|nr:MAG: hypothetical protein CR991_00205 [Pseudomonadota bacterium]